MRSKSAERLIHYHSSSRPTWERRENHRTESSSYVYLSPGYQFQNLSLRWHLGSGHLVSWNPIDLAFGVNRDFQSIRPFRLENVISKLPFCVTIYCQSISTHFIWLQSIWPTKAIGVYTELALGIVIPYAGFLLWVQLCTSMRSCWKTIPSGAWGYLCGRYSPPDEE